MPLNVNARNLPRPLPGAKRLEHDAVDVPFRDPQRRTIQRILEHRQCSTQIAVQFETPGTRRVHLRHKRTGRIANEQLRQRVPVHFNRGYRAAFVGRHFAKRLGGQCAGAITTPQAQRAVAAKRDQIRVTIAVGVGRHGRQMVGRREFGVERVQAIGPEAIVPEHLMRGRLAQHDEIDVAVIVQIGSQHLAGGCVAKVETALVAERPERPVEVVAQKLRRAVRVGDQDVQIAIVVGVEQGHIGTTLLAIVGVAAARAVTPAATGLLQPQLIAAIAAEIRIGRTIVVHVAPCGRRDAGDLGKWMIRRTLQFIFGAQKKRAGDVGGGRRDVQIQYAVALHVHHGHRRVAVQPTEPREGDGTFEQIALGRYGRQCAGQIDGHGIAARTHAGVFELCKTRARVIGQPRVRIQIGLGCVAITKTTQQLSRTVVGAAQIRIKGLRLFV